ncbi:uncharacterized protein [Solanum tuberosum]|uniref:uncharacterized protein n=1 Tax=Solanum tuberosum TaxID=4113 RepID=UPI00073A4A38|nr:PREDICTED: uncharacterized protein LOC107059508 [Solanum tuberosum]
MLTSAPVLAMTEGSEGYAVYCDTSGVGLGCVLMQRDPGSTLSYVTPFIAGKVCIVAESLHRPFTVSTPVFESIIDKRVYRGCTVEIIDPQTAVNLVELEMVDFYVIMDTEPPTLQSILVVNEFLDVFLDELCGIPPKREIDFSIDMLPGKANVEADALSRRSMGILSYLSVENCELAREFHQLASLGVRLLEADDSGAIIQDPTISSLVVEVKAWQHEDPSLEQLRDKAQVQQFVAFDIVGDGVLKYSCRLCIPDVAGMNKDVAEFVTHCHNCQQTNKISPFLPVKTTFTAEDYTGLYIREIFRLHGIPISIILDQGAQFTANFWKSFQKRLGTQVNLSTALHPQTDGQAEHIILTLEDMLRACILDFNGS